MGWASAVDIAACDSEVDSTLTKYQQDEAVTGYTRLIEFVDEKVVRKAQAPAIVTFVLLIHISSTP